MMNKKLLLIVVLVLLLGVVSYWLFYYKKPAPSVTEQAVSDLESTITSVQEDINKGVLPEMGTAVNPLENKPDINPVDQTNPFKDIKTNPFE